MRVRNLWWSSLFVALAGTVLVADPASATVFTVSDSAEYVAALTAASGDTSGAHTIVLDANVTVAATPVYAGTQALTIDGDGFTLSGGDTRRVLQVNGASPPAVTIQDIVVRDGFSATSGGAVTTLGPVTVTDAQFLDNRAAGPSVVVGGAMVTGTPTVITDSYFSANQAEGAMNTNGGAVVTNGASASLSITDSTFVDNSATSTTASATAGAAYSVGSVTATRSVFADNVATGANGAAGGALYGSNSVTLLTSVVDGNEASGGPGGGHGGGAYGNGSVTITDSSLTGNEVTGTGGIVEGAAAATEGSLGMTDSTVAGNEATGGTADAALAADVVSATHATISGNTGTPANVRTRDLLLLAASVIGQPEGGVNCSITNPSTASHSSVDDSSCGLPVSSVPVALGPPRDNGGPLVGDEHDAWEMATVFPLAGSPVSDVQVGTCGDLLDQRGEARPFGPGCDAGAIEGVYGPHGFGDVPAWVEDAVRWLASEDVSEPSLMVGLSSGGFGPSTPITRAQVVRLLSRLSDEPDPLAYGPHPFTDVPAWVEDAVRWASGEGIVTGETPTTFAPNDAITRGQVVRMVYRVAGSPDVSGIDPHPFSDVPNWVEEAVRWAANTDNPLPIVTGETPTLFRPTEDITRAQVGRMVYRLALTPGAWEDPGEAPRTVPFQVGGFF
jgi:hypothetical protein